MQRRSLIFGGASAVALLSIGRRANALFGLDALGGILNSFISVFTDLTKLLDLGAQFEFLGDVAGFSTEIQFYLDLAKDIEGYVSTLQKTQNLFENLYRNAEKIGTVDEGAVRKLRRIRILLERAQRTAETQSSVVNRQVGSAIYQEALTKVHRSPPVINLLGQSIATNEWMRLQAKQNDVLINQLTQMAAEASADTAMRAADELDKQALRDKFLEGLPDQPADLGPRQICVTLNGNEVCR